MRYRKLIGPNKDYSFGHGPNDFYIDLPITVGQAIETRLLLFQGQYFLDLTQGVPWLTQVFGFNTQTLYDAVIQQAILETPGVVSIVKYSSSLNAATRALTVNATVQTIYSGLASINAALPSFGYGVGPFSGHPYGR